MPNTTSPAPEGGVVATTRSPFARLHPVPVRAVRVGQGFWQPRLNKNSNETLREQLRKLEDTGTVDNFRRLYGAKNVERKGPYYTDSDLYKWMEACAWALQSADDPAIRAMLDGVIDAVAPAQGADGYLNTFYQDERFDQRWTDLERAHELYCAGHLFQAAVAHHRSTGQAKLLNVAARYADYICATFGPGPDRRPGHCGHPEIEMALVELYRETGVRAYLDTAAYFVDDNHGKDMREILGHAVRALYFCSAMADLYAETGDAAYMTALESLWRSMTETRMYITGAVGGRVRSESFGREWELPQENAYAETCAAIASAMWNWRMLMLKGEARFADLVELTLYNSIPSGIALDRDLYFYVNPHASNGRRTPDPWYKWEERGLPTRQDWFGCACCPPNLSRTFAALPGYFYSTSAEGLWVHLYDANTLDWKFENGAAVQMAVTTRYPWEGNVTLNVKSDSPEEFSLFLRVPGWTPGATVKVDGQALPAPRPGTYCEIRRRWDGGATVELALEMPVQPMMANPMAPELRDSVALMRGPLVYCFEGTDNPDVPVREASLNPNGRMVTRFEEGLLGGVTVVEAQGSVPAGTWGPLYKPYDPSPRRSAPVTLRGIPYYAWDNRGVNEMTVWLQRG